jgi:mono/diheme cytochrome c family protein
MLPKERYYRVLQGYALAVFAALCLVACTYNNEEELYGNRLTNCDTTNISYRADILPLLQSNCYVCHSQAAALGNVTLEGHSRVKNLADNGRLLGAVSHAAGFSPMPKNGNKLSACDINKIRRWINSGTPDN